MTVLQKIICCVRLQPKERCPVRFDWRNEQPISLFTDPDFFDIRGKTQFLWESHGLLAPFRNIDSLLATAVDMDLAVAFDVTDLFFPVRARFIMYPSV